MKTTITQEDIDNAHADILKNGRVSLSCLVMQACKRNNLPFAVCSFTHIWTKDVEIHGEAGQRAELPKSCQYLTHLNRNEWQSALGYEIELPEFPQENC